MQIVDGQSGTSIISFSKHELAKLGYDKVWVLFQTVNVKQLEHDKRLFVSDVLVKDAGQQIVISSSQVLNVGCLQPIVETVEHYIWNKYYNEEIIRRNIGIS